MTDGPRSVWSTLGQLPDGQAAVVRLPAVAAVRPRRIRRVRTSRWADYAGFDPDIGTRPRCHAAGCRRWLRKDQPFACSSDHEKKVRSALARLQAAVARGASCDD